MQVTLKRVNENVHFKGIGSAGVEINIDGSPSAGGINAGARPMELVLMALGSCSSIDIIQILKKQRQHISDFVVEVNGERSPDCIPSLFTNINVHYKLKGKLDEKKVDKAIKLSMEKYCSVTAILNKTANVSYSFEITNEN